MSKEKAVVILPIRLGSLRLPKKCLRQIAGRPLFLHALDCVLAPDSYETIIATDSEEVQELARKDGHNAVLTSSFCRSGTDRVAEIAKERPEEIIVNVQGDELFLTPAIVKKAITLIRDGASMGSCMCPLRSMEEYENPHEVKVLVNAKNDALYFFRRPFLKDREAGKGGENPFPLNTPYIGKHIGIYSYTKEFLMKFSSLDSTEIEKEESMEQLRALHYGYNIRIAKVDCNAIGVNTEKDFLLAKERIENNNSVSEKK